MLRYVAIGGVVGFVIAYFLLSHDAPPAPSEPVPAPMIHRHPTAVVVGEQLPVMPLAMQRAMPVRDGG